MEQMTTTQQQEKQPLTREEVIRRWKEHRRKKQEFIQELEKELRAAYKKRTGHEPESIEVW